MAFNNVKNLLSVCVQARWCCVWIQDLHEGILWNLCFLCVPPYPSTLGYFWTKLMNTSKPSCPRCWMTTWSFSTWTPSRIPCRAVWIPTLRSCLCCACLITLGECEVSMPTFQASHRVHLLPLLTHRALWWALDWLLRPSNPVMSDLMVGAQQNIIYMEEGWEENRELIPPTFNHPSMTLLIHNSKPCITACCCCDIVWLCWLSNDCCELDCIPWLLSWLQQGAPFLAHTCNLGCPGVVRPSDSEPTAIVSNIQTAFVVVIIFLIDWPWVRNQTNMVHC